VHQTSCRRTRKGWKAIPNIGWHGKALDSRIRKLLSKFDFYNDISFAPLTRNVITANSPEKKKCHSPSIIFNHFFRQREDTLIIMPPLYRCRTWSRITGILARGNGSINRLLTYDTVQSEKTRHRRDLTGGREQLYAITIHSRGIVSRI